MCFDLTGIYPSVADVDLHNIDISLVVKENEAGKPIYLRLRSIR